MKILFCGDVFIDRKIDLDIDRELTQILKNCDYACFNLEGPIGSSGIEKKPKRGPHLLNDESLPNYMNKIGYNIASLANNHIMDYGYEGLANTMEILNNEEILVVGAGKNDEQAYQFLFLDGDVKTGIISVAEKQFGACIDNNAGFAWMYNINVYREIQKAKEKCDIIIVLCHCGAEDINIPLPEVRELYYQFVDFGADVVIGNHPHVIQGSEEYKGRTIFYSLGNFIWDNNEVGSRSLGVCIDTNHGNSLICDTYEIKYYKGQLSICDIQEEYLKAKKELNNKDEYIKRIDDFCEHYYLEYLRFYYGQIVGFNIHDKSKQEEFIKHRIAGDNMRWDELLVYHNIAIETNRWITERAIKLIGSC